ncbi:MAG: porin [Planctomycetaceae bacterium]|nr:porin [Planctomycetales bacterium]MCB9926700.1 porin [Planctomycetaceae bacterium]
MVNRFQIWMIAWAVLLAVVPLRAQDGVVFESAQDLEAVTQRLQSLEFQMQQLRGGEFVFAQGGGFERTPTVQDVGFGGEQHCAGCAKSYGACDCTTKAGSGFPTVKVTGFFHLDAGFYGQDAVNRATLTDIEDVVGFRRARLAATGNVTERTSYMMEFDFAQAQARFVDVWMQFKETPVGNIRIGRYRQPFGMAELTSVRELPFLERPTIFALSPFRQTGIMFFDTALNERATWAISGYRYLSDNFGNVYADTGGYGLSTRITALPVDYGDTGLLHIGFDYSYNDPGRDLVQFASTDGFAGNQNPNLGLAGLSVLPITAIPAFVNTGAMPTSRTNLVNIEGAASWGRLLLQSEARWARVELTNGTTNIFPAAYAHMRYVLTGETIPYNRQAGAFGRVKPLQPADLWCGYWGAWEAAARVSYIDLNGTGLPGPGRRLTDVTLGLNWYLSDHVKFQFNWIHADLNDPTSGGSQAQTYAIRGQIDY